MCLGEGWPIGVLDTSPSPLWGGPGWGLRNPSYMRSERTT